MAGEFGGRSNAYTSINSNGNQVKIFGWRKQRSEEAYELGEKQQIEILSFYFFFVCVQSVRWPPTFRY